ncbi:MAG: O-antigen ligase family protein [Chloroflexi bacterium]|nr:O-antigen ligase family protein [Chloroflexota bacterium]
MAIKKGGDVAATNLLAKTDRRMYLVFLALLALVPLAFSRTPIEWIAPQIRGITFDQFDIAKLVTLRFLTLLILAFWAIKVWRARDAKLRFTVLDFTVIGFLLFATLSTIFSVHFPTSLQGKFKRYEGLLTYINYALLYFLALQTFYSEKRLRTFAKVMALTGGLIAVYGVMQFAGYDVFQWAQLPFEKHRSFSTFGNPDLLAGYLVLALPFSIACLLLEEGWRQLAGFFRRFALVIKNIPAWLRERKNAPKNRKNLDPAGWQATLGSEDWRAQMWGYLWGGRDPIIYSITTALIAINLITSLVRGAWIATGVMLFGIFLFLVIGTITKHVRKGALIGVGVTVAVIVLICGVVSASSEKLGDPNLNVINRLQSVTKLGEGSVASRIEIWKAAANIVKARPVLGWGPDTFRLASERYETAKYVQTGAGKTVSDNAHDYILQLAAGPGVPALVFFLILTVSIMIMGSVAVFRRQDDGFIIQLAFLSAAVGYFIHLLAGVSVIGSTSIFWVILGALAGESFLARERSFNPKEAFNAVIIGLAVVTSAVSFIYAGSMFIGDYYYAMGLSQQSVDPQVTINDYEAAAALYPNGRYYDSLGTYYLQLNQDRNDPQLLDKAIYWLDKAAAFEPLEADHQVFLANAYLVNPAPDRIAKARAILQATLNDIRPRSVPALFLLGEADRLSARYADAVKNYQEVLKYDPTYENGMLALGNAYEAMGDKKAALASYKRAVAFNPRERRALDGVKRVQ